MSDSIGKRLAQARDAKGLTQKQLAEKAGIDAITLSRYERNAQPMSMQRAATLAELLDVDRSWIADGIGRGPNAADPMPGAA